MLRPYNVQSLFGRISVGRGNQAQTA